MPVEARRRACLVRILSVDVVLDGFDAILPEILRRDLDQVRDLGLGSTQMGQTGVFAIFSGEYRQN